MIRFEDLQVGDKVWTSDWDNRRSDPPFSRDPSDFTIRYGEVVYRGAKGALLQAVTTDGDIVEWFHPEWRSWFANGQEVEDYLRKADVATGFALGEFAARLDEWAKKGHWRVGIVLCSLHGSYDPDEICFACQRKDRRHVKRMQYFSSKLEELKQLVEYTFFDDEDKKLYITEILNSIPHEKAYSTCEADSAGSGERHDEVVPDCSNHNGQDEVAPVVSGSRSS